MYTLSRSQVLPCRQTFASAKWLLQVSHCKQRFDTWQCSNLAATFATKPLSATVHEYTEVIDDGKDGVKRLTLGQAIATWKIAQDELGTDAILRSVTNTVNTCMQRNEFASALHILKQFPAKSSMYSALIQQAYTCKQYEQVLTEEASATLTTGALQVAALAATNLERFDDAHRIFVQISQRKAPPSTQSLTQWLEKVLEHDQDINRHAKLFGFLRLLDDLPYFNYTSSVYRVLLPYARSSQDVYDVFMHAKKHNCATDKLTCASVRALLEMMEAKTLQGQRAIALRYIVPIIKIKPCVSTMQPLLVRLARLSLFDTCADIAHKMSSLGASISANTAREVFEASKSVMQSARLRDKAHFALHGVLPKGTVDRMTMAFTRTTDLLLNVTKPNTPEDLEKVCTTIATVASQLHASELLPLAVRVAHNSGLPKPILNRTISACLDFFKKHTSDYVQKDLCHALAQCASILDEEVVARLLELRHRCTTLVTFPEAIALSNVFAGLQSSTFSELASSLPPPHPSLRPTLNSYYAQAIVMMPLAKHFFAAQKNRILLVLPVWPTTNYISLGHRWIEPAKSISASKAAFSSNSLDVDAVRHNDAERMIEFRGDPLETSRGTSHSNNNLPMNSRRALYNNRPHHIVFIRSEVCKVHVTQPENSLSSAFSIEALSNSESKNATDENTPYLTTYNASATTNNPSAAFQAVFVSTNADGGYTAIMPDGTTLTLPHLESVIAELGVHIGLV